MQIYKETKNRDGMKVVLNCLGCTYKDIDIKTYKGDDVPQELTISVGYPAGAVALGLAKKQDFAFPVEPKYDVEELGVAYSNGLLEVNIPIKGACVTEHKIQKAK